MWTSRMAIWLWSSIVLLGLVLHVSVVQGGLEHMCSLDTRQRGVHPRGICGSRLPDTVRGVCRTMGRGYAGAHRPFRKRADFLSYDDTADEGRLRGLLLSKRQAMSYLQRPQRPLSALGYFPNLPKRHGNQGITCECCYNHCSLGEILQYCN